KRYRLCQQSGRNSKFAPACGPSGFVELNVEDQIIGFDVFLHACAFLLEKYPSPEKKDGGVSPAALIVDVAVPLSGAAAARSAGSGWPAPARTPRSTGGSTAPGCSPLPRWYRPASGSTSRSATRSSGSSRSPDGSARSTG